MSMIDHNTNNSEDYLHGLGANERAILERIPVLFLRKQAAALVRLKQRFQFTGWLQYVLPMIFVILFFLIAGLAHLLNARLFAVPCAALGTLLLIVAVFDLVTVKFKLRFPEPLPRRNDNLGMFDLMRARRSCCSFQTRKLTPADHNELMESVRLHSEAPTIGKAPVRFEYVSAPLTVWPTVNATEFLMAIAPKEYHRLAVIDVGRSLQKIVMEATRMMLAWSAPGGTFQS